MNDFKRIITCCILCITALHYQSCKKNDIQKDWGESKVYMPQAAVTDGGLSNYYAVPLNNIFNNYELDTIKNILDVDLGIALSGLGDLNSFSVNVAADVDTTNQIIESGSIDNAVLLPADVYTIPASVTVPGGQSITPFHLTIDRAKLIAKYSKYSNKKLLLTVRISDLSKYVLNQSLSKTVVIIDAKKFMPAPPKVNLIQGGDMSAASAANWTVVLQDDGIGPDRLNTDIIFNGVLSWSNGTNAGTSNNAVYQAIQVVAGQKYRFSADVINPGTSTNSFYEIYLGAQIPVKGSTYSDNYYIGFNTWNAWDCSKKAVYGNLALVGCIGPGIGKEGIFTASFTGTMYFVIDAGSYGGNLGTITLDNVMVTEEE